MEFKNLEKIKSSSRITNFDNELNKALTNLEKKLKENPTCIPIMVVVVGSTMYGLDLPTSDIDLKGIYYQNHNDILIDFKLGSGDNTKYKATIGGAKKNSNSKTKDDIKLYEISKFFDMLNNNNPDILELLNVDEKFIIYEHPIWTYIKSELDKMILITKGCKKSFASYANSQIKKATGLNKKVNNPISIIKKTPLDFCYVVQNDSDKVRELQKWMIENEIDQQFCGLVNVPHSRGLYTLYYDQKSANIFSSKYKKDNYQELYNKAKESDKMGLGYKGIIKEVDDIVVSNQLRCSSIPKGEKFLCRISYNEDGFVKYCKDYREYYGKNGWIEQRNESRYNDNIVGGHNYDSKNMVHVMRLLTISHEIASGKGIIIERKDDKDFLLDIKKHKLTYDDIINNAIKLNNDIDLLFEKSNLPDNIDTENLYKILSNVRKMFYKDICLCKKYNHESTEILKISSKNYGDDGVGLTSEQIDDII